MSNQDEAAQAIPDQEPVSTRASGNTIATIVWTTVPDSKNAKNIAQTVVTERLAACVHCFPAGRSVYRWNDAIEENDEQVLMIKTTPKQLDALECRLRELHPYDVPEILATSVVAGDPDYLQWLNACVKQTSPA